MGDVRTRLESIDEFRGSAILLIVLANCLEGPDISVGVLLGVLLWLWHLLDSDLG